MQAVKMKFEPLKDAQDIPLDKIDVSNPELYRTDTWRPYFARLRNEDPVHFCEHSPYGPFWSITKYHDLIAVDSDWRTFSSDDSWGGVQLEELTKKNARPVFTRMDPPRHTVQRKAAQPAFQPSRLAELEPLIRERTQYVLDALPIDEEFDWVERVSVNLTSMLLATLFDYPLEERDRLIRWSNIFVAHVDAPNSPIRSEEERYAEVLKFGEHINAIWEERAKAPPRGDLISMLAHADGTKDMPFIDRVGIMVLMLAAGNDTTRNSMSGGLWAISQAPGEWVKLRERPDLASNAGPEMIRHHTPVCYFRRTATRDVEFSGKLIRQGSRVVMWYISGNRDETEIADADRFIVDRERPRQHLSFGFGIHRCLGNRLAELQLRILWEEILRRDLRIDVIGKPTYAYSNFIHGVEKLQAVVTQRKAAS